jgi:hypothetical protein
MRIQRWAGRGQWEETEVQAGVRAAPAAQRSRAEAYANVEPQALGKPQGSGHGERPHGVLARLGDAGRGVGTGLFGAGLGVLGGLRESALHFARGMLRLAEGRPLEALGALGRALVQLAQAPVDAHLLVGGRLLGALQTLVGLEPPGRSLRDDEVALLRGVFGAGLDLSAVRIKEGPAGLFSLSRRAFTLGNTVYVPPGSVPPAPGLLVHELTHVWQYQHGGMDYLSEALWAQYVGDGYDWRKGLSEGKRWEALNPEQQAELLEQAFLAGVLPPRLPPTPQQLAQGWTAERLAYLHQVLQGLPHGHGAP